MLDAPIRTAELRDELYAQVARHRTAGAASLLTRRAVAQLLRLISGCPVPLAQRRAWQLMAIVVALVPPSPAMLVGEQALLAARAL